MQAPNQKGHILIATDLESEIERIVEELKPLRSVVFFEETFKIEHAKAVVTEAYISSSEVKYIIIASADINAVAQNSLLKLLEEPPLNIEFIIISPTKSNLLPTVRSRLPILKVNTSHNKREVNLSFGRIDYKDVFAFLKEHARIKKSEAKELVEAMYNRAIIVDKLILTTTQLDNFDKAYRLLDLNSRPQSVLAMLIMSFVREK